MTFRCATFARRTLLSVALVASGPVYACVGYPGHGIVPLCTIPAATLSDQMIMVEVKNWSFGRELAPSFPMPGKPGEHARVVEVDVLDATTPIYLILSNGGPTVFSIRGATNNLTRVVALGSGRHGADAVGITGVARDKIHFAQPDYAVFSHKQLTTDASNTRCGAPPSACEASRIFFRYPASDKNPIAVQRTRPMRAYYPINGISPDLVPPGVTPAPAGLVPTAYFDEPMLATDPKSPVRLVAQTGRAEIAIPRAEDIIWAPHSPNPITTTYERPSPP